MAWQRRLRDASFRKIRFNLSNSETSFGRRGVTHEYINREEPYTEDLGRQARQFSVEGFISGFDYLRQRDRLITACEARGPGLLVHPYYGNRRVLCTSCQVREVGTAGGIAYFTMQFVEAGTLQFPTRVRNPKSLLAGTALGAKLAAINAFTSTFSIASRPQFVVDAAQSKIDALANDLESSLGFVNRNADEIADLANSIEDLRGDADALVNEPAVMARRMDQSISLLKSATVSRRESLGAYKQLFSYGDGDLVLNINTPSRDAERANNTATNDLVKTIAVAEASIVAAEVNYLSIEDAETERASLLEQIDALIMALTGREDPDVEILQALRQLKAQVIDSIPPEDQKLPSIFEFDNLRTLPSLVLTYSLYGSLDREQDVIDRNAIENPAFIPSGRRLRVLTRERD